MLADLLLPFPTSHPSTVPSDLIHPPLRNGTLLPYPRVRLLVFLLVQLIEAALYSSFRTPLHFTTFFSRHFSLSTASSISRSPSSAPPPSLLSSTLFLFPLLSSSTFFSSKPLSTRNANDATILITRYRYFADVPWHRHFQLD